MAKLKSEIEADVPVLQRRARRGYQSRTRRLAPRAGAWRQARASDAQRILAAEAARREALFEQSVQAEKTRGDALSRRFEEALKQAETEPITRPTRDFDLD